MSEFLLSNLEDGDIVCHLLTIYPGSRSRSRYLPTFHGLTFHDIISNNSNPSPHRYFGIVPTVETKRLLFYDYTKANRNPHNLCEWILHSRHLMGLCDIIFFSSKCAVEYGCIRLWQLEFPFSPIRERAKMKTKKLFRRKEGTKNPQRRIIEF